MATGRPRRPDASIPDHVDQAKLPKGCYWDKRDRVWYTILPGTKTSRRKIADSSALMSDLHRVMEQLAGTDRRSLDFVMEQFAGSEKFRSLAPATQDGYEKYRKVASEFPTAAGKLGTLAVRGLSAPLMWKMPTKARRQRRTSYSAICAACFAGRRTAATANTTHAQDSSKLKSRCAADSLTTRYSRTSRNSLAPAPLDGAPHVGTYEKT